MVDIRQSIAIAFSISLINTQNTEKIYVNILWSESRICDVRRECYINVILILSLKEYLIYIFNSGTVIWGEFYTPVCRKNKTHVTIIFFINRESIRFIPRFMRLNLHNRI